MIDNVVVGFKDSVQEPVVAHKVPEVFDRVQLGRFRPDAGSSRPSKSVGRPRSSRTLLRLPEAADENASMEIHLPLTLQLPGTTP